MRKIILKVHDIEFENNPKSVEEARKNTIELLKSKGYTFDGILISTKEKIAYIWKNMKPAKPIKPKKIHA